MSDHNFDSVIDRHNTNSIKWDCMPQYLGIDGNDLLPMWVSDFDFACPPAVQQALQQRVAHGVFGYSERRDNYFTAMQHWFARRHQLTIEREWIHSIEGGDPRYFTAVANADTTRRRGGYPGPLLWIFCQGHRSE
ncbi:hypothetical protein [Aeromonas veronii]|uniref:hypothetical protein n=1 Tax=Aeromonas veronii TaxID=654 RepID=UPI002442EAC0|nr:hypothetical protein [Aeromonas veronii]